MSVIIVSCHHREDVSWLQNQTEYEYAIYSKTDPSLGTLIDKNIGAESEAYLHYIVDHYDSLPETLVFIHGHSHANHQDGSIMAILASLGDLRRFNYKSLNNRMATIVYNRNEPINDIKARNNFWYASENQSAAFRHIPSHEYVLGQQSMPPYIYSHHSAQFIVHRDLILNRPLDYWKGLLRRMYALAENAPYSGKCIGIMFEVLWFYIITGHYDEGRYMDECKHLRY